jgi:cytochrome c-type biogenesis protein CcmH
MNGFVISAIVLAVLAAQCVGGVLPQGGLGGPVWGPRTAIASAPIAAVVAVLALIAASGLLYSKLGHPASARSVAPSASDKSIAALARHLESHPLDQAGWLDLGAGYGAIGQFPLAIRSYERANRLTNGTNVDALLGIGEAMLLSGDNNLGMRAPEYIERALQIEPRSPKALFYGAVIAYHQDHLEMARERFTTLLSLSPPENIKVAVQKEIDDIDSKLHPQLDEATAIHLHITLASTLTTKIPANAALFVFVPSPGGGPPLAVKRGAATLPLDVDLSAANSMIAGHGIRAGQKVSVIARISASGSPLPNSGDLYGQIEYVAGKSGARPLEIDKQTP